MAKKKTTPDRILSPQKTRCSPDSDFSEAAFVFLCSGGEAPENVGSMPLWSIYKG